MESMVLMLIIYFLCQLFVPSEGLKCDFETPCRDFVLDQYWGVTDGYHPKPLDHDNTYRNNSGHYIFVTDNFYPSQIVLNLDVSLNESRCLEFAYYTEKIPFHIIIEDQFTIATIQDSVSEWTPFSIVLPNLRYKLAIQVNRTRDSVLLLDDLFVGACSGPNPPVPVHTIYFCDFENGNVCELDSLPYYSYGWHMTSAFDANKHDESTPSKDYTFGNSSGHYFLSGMSYQSGGVGYFSTKVFRFSIDQTYCLHFLFYRIGYSTSSTDDATTLQVFAWTRSSGNQIYLLFESTSGRANRNWRSEFFPLPAGEYSLLFRIVRNKPWGGFALDNIGLTTCPYSSPTLNSTVGPFLKYSCDFEEDQCEMIVSTDSSNLLYNFTRINGNTLVDKSLGPLTDHTTNTSSGYFVYWNYTLPFLSNAIGQIITPKIETDVHMCLQFSYYVKSLDNLNGAKLSIDSKCNRRQLWNTVISDTNGWQTATVGLGSSACTNTIVFNIERSSPIAIAFALDDIVVDRCYIFDNPSTTTSKPTSLSTTITSESFSSLTKTSTLNTNSITPSKNAIDTTLQNSNSIQKKISHKTFFICISFLIFYFL